MAQRTVAVALLAVLLCVPSPGFARQPSHIYYLEIRGDEAVKTALLGALAGRTCFEEADLRSTESYIVSKEHGGECHAFREFRRSSDQRHTGHYLLRIELKDLVRGRRGYKLRGYLLTARKFEQLFDTGTSRFSESRFVKEATNEIALRTFQLRSEPERRVEPGPPYARDPDE